MLAPLDIPLLINDRVDVALAAEADGVHIGQDDMSPADARLLLGRTAIIGLSIKTVRAGARPRRSSISIMWRSAASTAPPRRTIPRRRSASPACARSCRRSARAIGKFPICAIAGINESNAAEVIAAGADGVAVISALSLAADPGAAARDLRAVVDDALARGAARPKAVHDRAIAVTIAGSDSSGGAGIQADLKTFAALGVYGACVITALTAQNTQGVTAIHDVPADFIAAQIDAVFSDLDVGAVKIGMLSQVAAIRGGGGGLDRHRAKNIVLDPVMVATSGDRLLAADAIAALRTS